MTGQLHLKIATPARVVIDSAAVRSVRAMDDSGSFGILPGHAALITVLSASVIEWCETSGERRYCVVRGGVLTVEDGQRVTIAARHAIPGGRLDDLEATVIEARATETEADRRARVAQVAFHAQAVRHLVQYLLPGAGGEGHDGLSALERS